MFRRIHRIIVLGCWGLLLVGAWSLYERREWFQPLVDEVEILKGLQVDSDKTQGIGQLSGEVVQVTGPDTFRIRAPDQTIYHFRLDGAQAPQERTLKGRRCQQEGREHLRQMILSKHVQVKMIYTNEYRLGLGMVFLGGTNINLAMVKAGLARTNPDQLKRLPVREQYDFLAAQKKAETEKAGIWK